MDLSRIINDPAPRKVLQPRSPSRKTSSPSRRSQSLDTVKQVEPAKRQRREKFASPPIWAQKANRKNTERQPPRKLIVPKVGETLGHWEPSILNVQPHEEFTRVVADFLYQYVAADGDIGIENIEIEAKIGQLIDQNTQQRVSLPVHTETIIRKDDPKLRTSFQSSMTMAQHSQYNQYLNAALAASLQKKDEPSTTHSRIPITYVHTRETDTMYELTQSAELNLPSAMRNILTPRFRRVRVTRDQKTGNEIAKIIKIRLADLDIHNPLTPFDWRISVNLEAPYEGDYHELPELMEKGKKPPPRNKDRLTYRHQGYQIDLTQVTIAGEGHGEEKEHELEIELDTAVLKGQAELLKNGNPNGYEEVIRVFIDNVRLLTRSSKY